MVRNRPESGQLFYLSTVPGGAKGLTKATLGGHSLSFAVYGSAVTTFSRMHFHCLPKPSTALSSSESLGHGHRASKNWRKAKASASHASFSTLAALFLRYYEHGV